MGTVKAAESDARAALALQTHGNAGRFYDLFQRSAIKKRWSIFRSFCSFFLSSFAIEKPFLPMACREGEIAEAPLTLYTHDHELPCQSHGGPGFINILSLFQCATGNRGGNNSRLSLTVFFLKISVYWQETVYITHTNGWWTCHRKLKSPAIAFAQREMAKCFKR